MKDEELVNLFQIIMEDIRSLQHDLAHLIDDMLRCGVIERREND